MPRQSANWDDFTTRIEHDPKLTARVIREAETNQRLSTIVSLASDWQRRHSRADALSRLRSAQARIVEERRLAPDPTAPRVQLSSSVRGMLPAIRAGRAPAEVRWHNGDLAGRFWRGLERGHWRYRTIQRIVERETQLSPQQWAAAHPYGSPVEPERIAALQADLTRMRPRSRRPVASLPPAFSPDRLTRIVTHLFRSL